VKFSANFARPLTSGPFLRPSVVVRALQKDTERILATDGVIAGERRFHRLLRAPGITGWEANKVR
jgi:hypothetical protein